MIRPPEDGWAEADTLAADGLLEAMPFSAADAIAAGIVRWRLPRDRSVEIPEVDWRRNLWRTLTAERPVEILALVEDARALEAARKLPGAQGVDGVLAQVRGLSGRPRWRSADVMHGIVSGKPAPAVLAVDVPFAELTSEIRFPSLVGDIAVIPDEPDNATSERLFELIRLADSSAICVVRRDAYEGFVSSLGDAAASGESMTSVLQRLARTHISESLIVTGLPFEEFRKGARPGLTVDRGIDFRIAVAESMTVARRFELGLVLDRMARIIASEAVPAEREKRRFLQAEIARRIGRRTEPARAIVRGEGARLSVWIGPPDDGGDYDPDRPFDFDVTEPLDLDVTVVMDGGEARRGRRRTKRIRLEPAGSSQRAEFSIPRVKTTQPSVRFEISVAHAGGLVQLAWYEVKVADDDASAMASAPPVLRVVAVNRSWAGAMVQPPRDAYLKIDQDGGITAHDASGAVVALRIDGPALVKELAETVDQMHDLRDLAAGIDDDQVEAFFRTCARMGARLVQELKDNQADFLSGAGDLQLVSLSPWRDIPIEIAYDQASPLPKVAKLCERKAEAFATGTCQQCPGDQRDRVCPAAFWGVRRVIERYLHEIPEHGDAQHGAGVTRERQHLPAFDKALFAASMRADVDQEGTSDAVCAALGELADTKAVTSWEQWKEQVGRHGPALLVALPHTERLEGDEVIEIGQRSLASVAELDTTYVTADPERPPLVMLLGCNTVHEGVELGSTITRFSRSNAAAVIGTRSVVLGRTAAIVAKALVAALRAASSGASLGNVIRDARCRALAAGVGEALLVTAFGDADWQLTPVPAKGAEGGR